MKIRNDFVTNSSSINFIIVNISDKDLTMCDFFLENPELLKSCRENADDVYNEVSWYTDNEILAILMLKTIKSGDVYYRDIGFERNGELEEILYFCDTKGGRSEHFIWKKAYG